MWIFRSKRDIKGLHKLSTHSWLSGTKNYAHASSVHFSRLVMSDSLRPHESQHARAPCPSPTPGVHSEPHPSSQWCHLAILSSVIPFSSCLQSFPASGSFQMKNPCIPVINPPWLWCMSFLIFCWILFAEILLRISASTFISNIGL